MEKVLVFDGRSRAALSIIRSLGEKGVYVITGESFECFSFYSKYTKEKIIYPSPSNNPVEFKEYILEYLKNNIEIIPTTGVSGAPSYAPIVPPTP